MLPPSSPTAMTATTLARGRALMELAFTNLTDRRMDYVLLLLCSSFFVQQRLALPLALLALLLMATPGLDYLALHFSKTNLQAVVLLSLHLWWLATSLFFHDKERNPIPTTLMLQMLVSVLRADLKVALVCLPLELLALLLHLRHDFQAAPFALVLLGLVAALEMDADVRYKHVLRPVERPQEASATPRNLRQQQQQQAKSKSGNTAVNRLFMKAFGNYDQFSREVTRYVREVKAGLGKHSLQLLDEKEIDFSSFELERKLASGGFCTVFRGKYLGQKQCAVKSFSSSDQLDSAGLCGLVKEIVTLIELDHPNIIRVFGYCWLPQVCLVMEYMPKGTLHDMLVYKELELGWHSPLTGIAIQISDALHYLHTRSPPIIHRDIKARNILMKDFRTCKLADFGLLTEENSTAPRAGTLRYVAPEVATGEDCFQQNRTRSDIWSLGVCFWEMATRAQFSGLPFLTSTHQRVLFHSRLPYPIPMPIYQVIDACLESDPELRVITAGEVNERLQDCLPLVLDEDRSTWFSGDMNPDGAKYSAHVTNDLSVDASQAWRLGSAMWRGNANVKPQKKESSSRSLESALAAARAAAATSTAPPPPPPPQSAANAGLFSRLAHVENRAQAEVYERFANTSRGLMEVIPESTEGSPSASKQSIKSWSSDAASGEPETPPFSEQRRLLAPGTMVGQRLSPSSETAAVAAGTNRFLARMSEQAKPSSLAAAASGNSSAQLTTITEESQSPQTLSRSLLERESAAAADSAALFEKQQDEYETSKTLARHSSLGFMSETEFVPVDYDAMYQQTFFLRDKEKEEEQADTGGGGGMLGRLAMAEKETSRSLQQKVPTGRGGGGLLSRLGQAEKEAAASRPGPAADSGGLLTRLGQAEKESSRSFQAHLQTIAKADAQPQQQQQPPLLDRIRPKPKEAAAMQEEEEGIKGIWDRLDRVEKQTSRSLFEKFSAAPAADAPSSSSSSALPVEANHLLSRINFDEGTPELGMRDRLDRVEKESSRSLSALLAKKQDQPASSAFLSRIKVEEDAEDEGMINRLDRVEKQTSRSLFAHFPAPQAPPSEAAVEEVLRKNPFLSRISLEEEDEGMINRLDRVEKQTSRSLFAHFPLPQAPPSEVVVEEMARKNPLLSRISLEEEDEGMINRLDRVEKQTSRSLFAHFPAPQAPPNEAAMEEVVRKNPFLSRISLEEEDEGMINRLDRVEKQTSRSLFAQFPAPQAPPSEAVVEEVARKNPLLSRISLEEEDEGMINRLDRVEKQTSRSLFAKFENNESMTAAAATASRFLARVDFEQDEEPVLSSLPAEEPVLSSPPTEEPVVSSPPTEEPIVSSPLAEEPVVSSPPAEEPVVSSPPAEEPAISAPPPPTTPNKTPSPSTAPSTPTAETHLVERLLASSNTSNNNSPKQIISPSARSILQSLNGNNLFAQ